MRIENRLIGGHRVYLVTKTEVPCRIVEITEIPRGATWGNYQHDIASTDASLKGFHLLAPGSDFSHARLSNVGIIGADLEGVILEGAHLEDAGFKGCNLEGANFRSAKLSKSYFGSYFEHVQVLHNTDFSMADLRGAEFDLSVMPSCNFFRAQLGGANLFRAEMVECDLTEAHLEGVEMNMARLQGCVCTKTDFRGADLRGCKVDYASVKYANFTGARLEGSGDWDRAFDVNLAIGMSFSGPTPDKKRSYGKYTGAIIKASKPEAPRSPKEFKAKYPFEAESIKGISRGGMIDAAVKAAALSGVEWTVTRAKFFLDEQRLSPEPNDVLMFNFDASDPAVSDLQREAFLQLARSTRVRYHPHEYGRLVTVGWVRFASFPGTILVEEIQSDLDAVRHGVLSDQAMDQMWAKDTSTARQRALLKSIEPWTTAFLHDAMGTIFNIAHSMGADVEMLSYEHKVEAAKAAALGDQPDAAEGEESEEVEYDKPPKLIYEKLPKQMGMKLVPASKVLLAAGKVYHYSPNRRRSPGTRC